MQVRVRPTREGVRRCNDAGGEAFGASLEKATAAAGTSRVFEGLGASRRRLGATSSYRRLPLGQAVVVTMFWLAVSTQVALSTTRSIIASESTAGPSG